MKQNIRNLKFKIDCIKCGEPLEITFDRDGDVEGGIIGCGLVWSDLFDCWCTPLVGGGFRHGFCF